MNVTHSYITKSADIAHITSDKGLPCNFTMGGTGLWKRCDWAWVGSAYFEQTADVRLVGKFAMVVIEQSLAIEVLNQDAISILLSYSEVCDLVAAHFTGDGRCFFQGIDLKDGVFAHKSRSLSTRVRIKKAEANKKGTLWWADLIGKTGVLAPMLLPDAAAEMEKVLKSL